MNSVARNLANQANAQLSTGPRTTEGKSHSSQNARKHGLTAKHLVIRDDEHEEFQIFLDNLITEIQPQGSLEAITFDELVHAAWTLRRCHRALREQVLMQVSPIDPETGEQNEELLEQAYRDTEEFIRRTMEESLDDRPKVIEIK